ncbi:alternate-type signal peptide domain-containing protein [Arthrobacter sp.]|uniref:alternate-type signal peptide domain-containing protein n=1 Tax=Arthrobacter sp. TaxID=1667 RepID=UPI002899D3B7|nr:alternate-type signal peptide domain-containing protein [Arthrobacter sp.]
MNKMAKGALATGVGVALLLGGGGTLAVWNQSASANAGTIVAGDLNLVAAKGVWTNAKGTIVDPASYKVVPGDVLTYTQTLDVTLVGDLMNAKLTLSGAASAFQNAQVSPIELKGATAGGVLNAASLTPATIPADKKVTASTKFTFNSATTGRDDVNKTADFTNLSYSLEQIAPK